MIVFDRTCGTFTLHTRSTTYQMKADQYGVLLHRSEEHTSELQSQR